MKILIHSNAPWVNSGYGVQTKHMIKTFRELGHEVAVSAFTGLSGASMYRDGVLYLPNGNYEFGIDVLPGHIDAVDPDLTITLMDIWKLGPIMGKLKQHNVAAWIPVDCDPLSKLDNEVLKQTGIKPIAMSNFGMVQLLGKGYSPNYVPHSVDTDVFKPLSPEDRADYREKLGLTDRFVIGICSANNDTIRKGYPEQFYAFKRFHDTNPEAFLMVHTIADSSRGLRLDMLAHDMGIPADAIRFTDTYPQITGGFDETLMADWYGVLDVLSVCSYAEAFGVPLIEAQACGTPVITTDGSAMKELSEHGWAVRSDRFWNHVHGAWWQRPDSDAIRRAYVKARQFASSRRLRARGFAIDYDTNLVASEYWEPTLEVLAPRK